MNRRNLLQLAAATPLALALPMVAEAAVLYPELHIWHSDTESVIAASPEDADALTRELCGYDPEEEFGEPAHERWLKLDDEKPLTIWWDGDELLGFNLSPKKQSKRPGWVPATAHAITKTRAEWCVELGRSYLGSTEV